MAQKNQAVLDMIDQVRARLVDLEGAVLDFDGDLTGLAEKIDRIDDRLYLLEVDIRKRAEAAGDADGSGETAPQEEASNGSEAERPESGEGDGMNILTPEAKEKIGEAVGDMREIGREAAETLSELNEAFSDITGPFKSLTGRGKRR